MRDTIPYKITWTDEKRKVVCDQIEKWMYERGSCAFYGESIVQSDDCQIEASSLIATIVDDIIKPELL